MFRFLTILFAVITLSALAAHVLELPGKISLSQEDYQVVQSIYRGWSWLGIFEIGAILLTLIWVLVDQKKKTMFPFLLAALVCFIVSISIFFILTFPANRATINWTQLPQNWHSLRKNWEYSHAIRAVLSLAGFSFLIVAILREKNGYRY